MLSERGASGRATDLSRELDVAAALAREAGALLLDLRGRPLDVRHKAGGEIVTAADLAADAHIRAGLARAFPGDALVSEEATAREDRAAQRRLWIVDPIDATRDYARGGDEFVVSIGLALAGAPALGAVFAPARRELFTGAVGGGAWLNGAPVRVTATSSLAAARVTVSRSEPGASLDKAALPFTPTKVSSAAYKLARVAAGLDDGTFSGQPRRDWDVCAGAALVLAAGGAVTLLDGRLLRFDRPELLQPLGLVAAGPALHPALRAALATLL
jgi:myo-inositol-1(or 4)-monophosphatase